MKYKIYFEFFGRKMQTEIQAENKEQAKHIIKNRIIFHEVKESTDDDTLNLIKEMLGIK